MIENLTCEAILKDNFKLAPVLPCEASILQKRRSVVRKKSLVMCIINKLFPINYVKKWAAKNSQFSTILILSIVEFFAATVISIQAPFYPEVARGKGASATEYGLVFGIFEIAVFIMSPILGAKMDVLGPRRVFNWGILTSGVCCVVFGFLDDAVDNRTVFISSCLVVRAMEAIGAAAFDTASFTIIAIQFPNSVATSFATLEICYGLGLIIGPTIGGCLYQLGGYKLPFIAMGGLLFVSAIFAHLLLPEPHCSSKIGKTRKNSVTGINEVSPGSRGGSGMFKVLRIPVVAMTAYSIVAATAGVGFISANLDYHLEQFHLNKVALGFVFIMNGGVYALTAPLWGWICDRISNIKLVTFVGSIFVIVGFIFIGPIPYFPYDTTVSMSSVGLALFGFGFAATQVSAFIQFLNDVIAHGYPDDVSTYGLVSGLWTSMSALGYFIGPTLGGVAVDAVGFRCASLLVIAGELVVVIALSGYFCAKIYRAKTSHGIENANFEFERKETLDNSFKSIALDAE